jgi:hypothetical protein
MSEVVSVLMSQRPFYDTPSGVWRIPSGTALHNSAISSTNNHRVHKPPSFCLHLQTEPSVAGTICHHCGVVVASVNNPGEGRGPVSVKMPAPIHDPLGDVIPDSEQARTEWDHHTTGIIHQPLEVMQHAWVIFQQVFGSNGSVSGVKAKALVLVSLLYSSRLLHGSNKGNEEYLLKCLQTRVVSRGTCFTYGVMVLYTTLLQTPTRVMNKAFTQMATVTLPKSTKLVL